MLELLAQVDPLAAVLGGLWLFAAGMFPLGFMLGAPCSACCNSCELCTEGQLPETLTVTFDGLEDKTPGPDLITLSFSACYGSSAEARVTAPGGDPATDKGPLGAVSLTSGGSGYARLGRVAPTLTVSGGSGSGATFTPTLETSKDSCGLDRWALKSVAVKGGKDYVDGEPLTITVATGDTEEQAATAIVHTEREEPTLSLDGNATASITLDDNGDGTWRVASISITNGGSGYSDNYPIPITLGPDDVEVGAAVVYGYTGRIEPTVSVTPHETPGTGATFTPTLTQGTSPFDGRDAWTISGATITAAGTGYSVGDMLLGQATDGLPVDGGFNVGSVTAVDANGGITGVSVGGGWFYKSDGMLQSVDVLYGGLYYKDTGEPASVEVTGGGTYYREDASLPPYVADVTVGISQTAPSNGTGATLTASVEDDTASANFGKITGVTIGNGGDNYLAWQWRNTKCCGDYYNGLSVVLKRNNDCIPGGSASGVCTYTHRFCGVGNARGFLGNATLTYRGPSLAPTLSLVSEAAQLASLCANTSDQFGLSGICNTFFTATGNVTNCSNWAGVSFSASGGATASVTAGGSYDATFRNPGGGACSICCKGESQVPLEIEATINDPRTYRPVDFSGTYVLPWRGQASGFGGIIQSGSVWYTFYQPPNPPPFTSPFVFISVWTEPCSSQTTTGFGPDDWGCDDCHKKCRERASVMLANNSSAAGQCGYATAIDEQTACSLCVETPICSMAGKSFQLQSTCSGTVTLTT